MKSSYKYITAFILLVFFVGQAFPQNGSFTLPAYQKFTLPNGLTVYLMEQHEVPMINVSAVVPAGAIYDGDQHGLASLTAEALMQGTKKFSKSQIEEELDFVGADVNAFATKEAAGLRAKFAAKDKTKVLNIIKEILTDPLFDEKEFDKEKKRTLVNLEQEKESPSAVISSFWDKMFYGDHVYGNKVNGAISSVSKLSANDLKNFYNNNYQPNGAALAIVGDFNAKDMKEMVTRLFKDWKKGASKIENPSAKPVKMPAAGKVLLVNKDDARETTLYIGGAGVKRSNPDYVALQVVNTAFGGRFTSWLNDELRVNSGLTYGARSNFSALKNAGTFYISTFTATKTTEPTIDKALEVLSKLHKEGFDENTLTSAKNYVKGQYPPRFETSGQLAGLLTDMFWYGFDESFINNFQKNVDGITVQKAKEIVAKYYPKDKLQFVLVGKSADIKKIAEKYGPVEEVQIKDDKTKAF